MATCVFCERDTKLSDEHVLPDWLLEAVPPHDPTARKTRFLGHLSNTEGLVLRTRDEGPVSVATKVKVVCEAECNNGWMSRLESVVKPLLLPMIFGEDTDLAPDAQRIIALWTTKTMIMVEYTDDRTRATSRAQRRYVYERRKPPPLTTVWIGKYDDGKPLGLRYRHRAAGIGAIRPGGHIEPTDHVNVETTLFLLGHLALMVLTAELPGTIWLPLRFGRHARSLRRITASGPLRWPPGPSLNEQAANAVAEALLTMDADLSFLGSQAPQPRRD